MSNVSMEMKISEESFESNLGSVKYSNDDRKGRPIQACTLESVFEGPSVSSSKDVPIPTSKDSSISEEKNK